jgi:hypothetical protein
MATDRLTVRTIVTSKPRAKVFLVPDGRGLYLKVQPGGAKSWLLRYQLGGKVHGVVGARTIAAGDRAGIDDIAAARERDPGRAGIARAECKLATETAGTASIFAVTNPSGIASETRPAGSSVSEQS